MDTRMPGDPCWDPSAPPANLKPIVEAINQGVETVLTGTKSVKTSKAAKKLGLHRMPTLHTEMSSKLQRDTKLKPVHVMNFILAPVVKQVKFENLANIGNAAVYLVQGIADDSTGTCVAKFVDISPVAHANLCILRSDPKTAGMIVPIYSMKLFTDANDDTSDQYRAVQVQSYCPLGDLAKYFEKAEPVCTKIDNDNVKLNFEEDSVLKFKAISSESSYVFEALRLSSALAHAYIDINKKGLYFTDIKPGNMLVDVDENKAVKILFHDYKSLVDPSEIDDAQYTSVFVNLMPIVSGRKGFDFEDKKNELGVKAHLERGQCQLIGISLFLAVTGKSIADFDEPGSSKSGAVRQIEPLDLENIRIFNSKQGALLKNFLYELLFGLKQEDKQKKFFSLKKVKALFSLADACDRFEKACKEAGVDLDPSRSLASVVMDRLAPVVLKKTDSSQMLIQRGVNLKPISSATDLNVGTDSGMKNK